MDERETLLSKIEKRFLRKPVVLSVWILISVVISAQQYLLGEKLFYPSTFTHYNNFIIFRNSFHHLISCQNLYGEYSQEYWDLFKYSPTFALLIAPFSLLPDLPGLIAWNLLNSLVLFFSIVNIQNISLKIRYAFCFLILPDLIIAIQNSQSNALVAGLIIAGCNSYEKNKLLRAAAMILLSAFIKIFALAAFLLVFLYPKRMKSALLAVISALAFFALPLLVISFRQLIVQYQNWGNLLQSDHSTYAGLSIFSWLQTWFALPSSKYLVTAIGCFLLLLPLLRINSYKFALFRIWMLSSVLLWVIIFNHKAESSTYIIAMCGALLWYFSQQRSTLNTWLLGLAIIFTSLSGSDLFPHVIRKTFFIPYVVKTIPCILIWAKLLYDLITKNFNEKQIM